MFVPRPAYSITGHGLLFGDKNNYEVFSISTKYSGAVYDTLRPAQRMCDGSRYIDTTSISL
jgi:hypothetical protein